MPTSKENNKSANESESSSSPPTVEEKQHEYHESLSTLNEASGEESNPIKSPSNNTTNGARINNDNTMRF